MTGALFRLAFRQSIVPACLGVGAILSITAALVGFGRLRDMAGPLLGISALFLVWSGFLAGARLFSREFKERHVLLIQVLPIARPLAWAGWFLGGLAAGLTSLGLLVCLGLPQFSALRESVARSEIPPGFLLGLPLLIYLSFFAAGSCYGLLLSGTAVHAVGLVATLAAVANAIFFVLGLRANPSGSRFDALLDPLNLPGIGELASVGILAFLLYAALSAWFYARGELLLARQRWRNVAALLMGHLVFFALLQGSSMARVRGASLVLDESGPGRHSLALSSDGRYASVVERRAGFPRFCRVQVVEVLTGRLLGSREMADVRSLAWSRDTLVAALARAPGAMRLLPRDPSDTVLFLSKELRDLRHERLDPGMTVEGLLAQGNEIFVAGRLDDGCRLSTLRTDGGLSRTLLETEDPSLDVASLDDGALAAFGHREDGREHAWLLKPVVHEIPAFGSPTLRSRAFVIGSGLYAGSAIAEEMRRRFPWPSSVGSPLLPPPHYVFWSFAERPGFVFVLVAKAGVATVDLFVLVPGENEWRPVTRGLEAPSPELEPPIGPSCEGGMGNLQLCPDGRVAWKDGDRRLVVHDTLTGRQHVIETDPPFLFELRGDAPAAGTLIVLRRGRLDPHGFTVLDEGPRFYLWTRGAETPVELPSGPTLFDRDFAVVGGGIVYGSRQHGGVFFAKPGAAERQVWPVPETP